MLQLTGTWSGTTERDREREGDSIGSERWRQIQRDTERETDSIERERRRQIQRDRQTERGRHTA